jgi:hypothetical protein
MKSVGDSHEGPLRNGGILLKTCKKHKTQTHLEHNTKHTHTAQAHAAMAPAAHQSGPTRHPLEQGLPRSRAHAPPRAGSASLEGSRSLGRAPPRSRVPAPSRRLRLA